MIMDAQNRPSNGQTVTGNGVTVVSTDRIDMLIAGRNVGRGGVMRMIAHVTTLYAGGTSIQAQLIETNNADGTSPTVLASGPVTTIANAIAGAELLDVLVPDTAKRYLGTQYILIGNVTAGAVTAGIVAGSNVPSTTIPMNTGL